MRLAIGLICFLLGIFMCIMGLEKATTGWSFCALGGVVLTIVGLAFIISYDGQDLGDRKDF